MTNGFGKLLFQNHNGSMRITRSPFIRSFIRIFITGKTCSYMYTTSALHNLKVSRAEISTVFFYEEIYFGTLIEQSVCEKNLYEICSTFFECSLVFSTFDCTCMMFSPFFVNNKIYFRKEESDIFSYRGFLVPNVMKNEVEK